MNPIWQAMLTIVGTAAVVGLPAWIARRARRGLGSVLGAVDEIFHPAAYEPRIEVQRQAGRRDELPAPGDSPWLLDDGRPDG